MAIGDIVDYVLEDGRNPGEIRPAIITKEHSSEDHPGNPVHLTVFVVEGDFDQLPNGGTMLRTFVLPDDTDERKPGTCRRKHSAIPARQSAIRPPKPNEPPEK